MNRTRLNNVGYLDNVRLGQGAAVLRRVFGDLTVHDRQKAIRHLNDDNLQFPTLFILMPDIEAHDLYQALTARSNAAIRVCAKKSNNSMLSARLEQLVPKDERATHRALKWMFQTGLSWDGPLELYDAFDAVMDAAAALLLRTYHDTSVLPAVCELMFRRNRKGLLIHDLVWSFFQVYDPNALRLIAKRLLSDNPGDVQLACRLLHLTLPDGAAARQRLYRQYLSWLSENKPYLRFTGEHFQQTSEPEPFRVDAEAKYLGKPISPKDGKPLKPLTQEESACLNRFRTASEHDRELLSACSARIHARNIRAWKNWMHAAISEQVIAAKSELQVV